MFVGARIQRVSPRDISSATFPILSILFRTARPVQVAGSRRAGRALGPGSQAVSRLRVRLLASKGNQKENQHEARLQTPPSHTLGSLKRRATHKSQTRAQSRGSSATTTIF